MRELWVGGGGSGWEGEALAAMQLSGGMGAPPPFSSPGTCSAAVQLHQSPEQQQHSIDSVHRVVLQASLVHQEAQVDKGRSAFGGQQRQGVGVRLALHSRWVEPSHRSTSTSC